MLHVCQRSISRRVHPAGAGRDILAVMRSFKVNLCGSFIHGCQRSFDGTPGSGDTEDSTAIRHDRTSLVHRAGMKYLHTINTLGIG